MPRARPFRLLLLILAGGALAGCEAELYHGLGERQANRALLGLREAGFAADKEPERGGARGATFTLTVPRGDETRALRVLEERGLVRPPAPRPQRGLLPLPEESRQAQALDLAEGLSATLESLPEVVEARVHLTLPAEDPLRREPAPAERAGAAVLLRLRAPLSLSQTEVAELVARAVPGLAPGAVTVLRAQEAPPPARADELVSLGPLRVPASAARLVSALLGAVCLLGAALLVTLLRRRPAA